MKSTYTKLQDRISAVGNCLCLGLDPDISRLPTGFSADISGVRRFLLTAIQVTQDLVCAYKPNLAFFEGLGIEGIRLLMEIRSAIPDTIPLICDGKRADIGNTSQAQAKWLYQHLGADAVTVNPYMGRDAVAPFLADPDKLVFLLCLTSNPGSSDFQRQRLQSGKPLYEFVLETASAWAGYPQLGFVVGATASELNQIRIIDPQRVLLVPGIGAQGGDYKTSVSQAKNHEGLAVINVSRSVLYANGDPEDLSPMPDRIRQIIGTI